MSESWNYQVQNVTNVGFSNQISYFCIADFKIYCPWNSHKSIFVTITPRPPEYINFFETISILAGDLQVVSLRHKKYNQGSGRKRTNEQYGLG